MARGESDDGGDGTWVARCEDDVCGFDRHVGAGADGESDVGAGESGSVVDAVADHRDAEVLRLELADGVVLVLGEHFGEHASYAEVGRDGVGDLSGIAGDEHDLHVQCLELVDGVASFGAYLVLEREGRDDCAAVDEVEDRRAACGPLSGRCLQLGRDYDVGFRSSPGPPTA